MLILLLKIKNQLYSKILFKIHLMLIMKLPLAQIDFNLPFKMEKTLGNQDQTHQFRK